MAILVKKRPAPPGTRPARRSRPPLRRQHESFGRTLISDKELGGPRARIVYWIVLTLSTILFTLAVVFPLYWMFASAV